MFIFFVKSKTNCQLIYKLYRHTALSVVILTAMPALFAETILVTASNGAIDPKDGACSISEAIINANADDKEHGDCNPGKGADLIVLPGNVTLEESVDKAGGYNGTPSITSDITVDGQGYTLQRRSDLPCSLDDDSGTNEFRLFHVGLGNLTLENITLANGCADGSASAGYGGAIYNLGALTLTNTTLLNNAAASGGGAISNHGTLSILSRSRVAQNSADFGGGVYTNSGTIATISDSMLSGNAALYGGAIYNGYNGILTTLNNSTVADNKAGYGGGVYNSYNATLTTISNTTFSDNMANFGAGIYNDGSLYGGNISLNTIYNSTFSGNSATYRGGGIYNKKNLTSLLNCTFLGNSASSGGGIYIYTSEVGTLINTIFTQTTSGGDCALINGGKITLSDNNLSSDNSCPGDIGNITNFDSELADNGCVIPGPNGCVRTHALLAGSNAINAAVNGTAHDQRGFPATGIRDIGAYESKFSRGGCLPYTSEDKLLMICW
jgi:predicted outer membrane repeat protein